MNKDHRSHPCSTSYTHLAPDHSCVILSTNMVFRLQSRHIALTYPQSTLDKQRLFDYLKTIRNVERVLVCQEDHSEHGYHFHCYVRFRASPRTNITDPHFFDLEENHPNFQACRNVSDWITYCLKEDPNPFTNFSLTTEQETLQEILNDVKDHKNALEIFTKAVTSCPKLLTNGSSLIASIKFLLSQSETLYDLPRFPLNTFALDPSDFSFLRNWSQTVLSMQRGDRGAIKSLWLYGPSMTGKTALSRSLGCHWYMSTSWNLSKISNAEKIYGVIDDINWDSLRYYYKGLLGRQQDVTFTDKYCHKLEKKMGLPVIICSNELPEFSHEETIWLRRNVSFFCVENPILPNSPVSALFPMNL